MEKSIESECEAQRGTQVREDICEGYLENFVGVIWSETEEELVGT